MPEQKVTVAEAARGRLHFLDGLRGLACLYVLLFHELNNDAISPSQLNPALKGVRAWFDYGRLSVVFFIVLSGFSLMLPIARSGKMALVGGFASFVRRRARRILPPYYAALLMSVALIATLNLLGARLGLGRRIDGVALSAGSLASHVFLLHNLNFDWAYRINGPMWSVATEWQIYFIFALLLLPLCARAGAMITLVVAWLLGCLPFFLLPPETNFFWACPWFIGSFALGMWGALIGYAPSYASSRLAQGTPWRGLTVLSFAALVAMVLFGYAKTWSFPFVDLVVSLFAICWINACVMLQRHGKRSLMLQILGSRALVYLGGFSYSLYLIQHPILKFIERGLLRLHLGSNMAAVLELLLVTPLVLAFAWLFSELFERPFSSGGTLLPALRRRFELARPSA
jgi:peptidoglycan/LPS O-acetylase OafA/YrhL